MSREIESPGGLAFPTTRWSTLLAGRSDAEAAREAFEALARRYWGPVAAYVRARFAKTDDDAREATQEFFLWMLEGGFLERADPARGRFRGFVKRSLANFLHDAARRRRSVKRGGTRTALSFERDDLPPVPDPSGRNPEAVLDDLWRKELLAQGADRLEAELTERGKRVTYEVFRDYFLGDEELDYRQVAARHGVTTTDVSNHLAFAKKRYRAHLRAAVLETVQSDEDLRAELSWLFEDAPG